VGSTGAGRAKLRLSRGFPLGLARQRHPHKFSLGLFDHFTPNEQEVELLASLIFRLTMPMAALAHFRGARRFELHVNIAG
jgi:hypothetical protein